MSSHENSAPRFRLINFQSLCGVAAVFDLEILGVGRIQDMIFVQREPGQPGIINCVPLALGRESVDGDLVSGTCRRPFLPEGRLAEQVALEVQRVLERDRMFLGAHGHDAFSEVVLPSHRDMAVDWRG